MSRWNARPQNSRRRPDPVETMFWTGGPRKNGQPLQKAEPPKTSGRPRRLEEDIEADDYRDGRPFRAYCLIVASVLGSEPIPIREVNRRLGERAREHWTMDALDRVADLHPAYIDKFSKKKETSNETAARGNSAQSDSDGLELPEDL